MEDFVSLADLAPTFLEAAGIRPPSQMTPRSLIPLLTAKQAGRVDPRRDHVLTGMERHVPSRGEIRGGYPMRAIRARDFLYIRNFKPDRWPLADPSTREIPFEELARNTFSTLADINSGPSRSS